MGQKRRLLGAFDGLKNISTVVLMVVFGGFSPRRLHSCAYPGKEELCPAVNWPNAPFYELIPDPGGSSCTMWVI